MDKSRPELPDIDFDTEARKRAKIFSAVQRYFNSIDSEVINVCTVGTLGTKSAIRTAGKGLEMEDAIINYIVSLVPNERGKDWTMDECRYGTDEKPKIAQFATQMATYPALWSLAKRIEGLVTNLSVHASGVLIVNGSITEHNCVMKTSKGICVTGWDLHDSEQAGGLKYDFLTVQAIDKIRACMSYLLDLGYMEWQGSLKETYDTYLLPTNLDYYSPEMWEMVSKGEIAELFQYDTMQGAKAAKLIKPASLRDLAAGNAILRLMAAEGEQPLETFAKYKANINLWYNELRLHHLSDREVKLLEKYLLPTYGVAGSQELMMLLTMDPEIANFTVPEANKLRKAVAKKKHDLLVQSEELFFKKGREIGTSEALLNYVWNIQIMRQAGYSFSDLHTVAYSTIALQEANLAYYYPQIVWNCACLSIDADAIDENSFSYIEDIADYWIDDEEEDDEEITEDGEKKKKASKVNYDKIAIALGHFKDTKIELPDINEAKLGFMPNVEENSIMFGLKGLSRIGDDIVNEIIARRPYASLEDFIDKMRKDDGKTLISKDRIVNLIKAGCFDKLLHSRVEAMKYYIGMLVPYKKNITLQNMGKLIEYDMLPHDLDLEKGIYLFTKEARKRKDGNGYYCLDEIMVLWYRKWMKQDPPMLGNGYRIKATKWEEFYNGAMDKVRAWINANKSFLIEEMHRIEFENEWNKYADGDELKWELDSLNFYHSGHPLSGVKLNYDITPVDMLIDNEFSGYWTIKGVQVPKAVLRNIKGTVLVKNKQKNIIVLSTPEGVMQVKIYKSQFAKYDKTLKGEDGEILEESFLDKGTHLMITGVLRDGVFIPKIYKDTGHEPIMKIVMGDQLQLVEKHG